jgi:subtilase family serine protease
MAGALLCGAAAKAQDAAHAARIVNQIDENQRITLKGTIHPLANAANDRGAVADSMKLERIHLVLKRSDSQESSLRQLITDLHTPGTASYHKWLTPDQFGKQFGPSDQDIATVQAWLTSHGFSVTKVNPGKQTIEFTGNAGQMREAFHTQIHQYQVKGETHFANAGDPQIPAALAPVVGGFASLNNFRAKSHARPLGKALYDPKTDKATPQWTMSGGYNFVLSPGDYAVQYDLNPLYAAGVNGAGQTIAIVNDSNVNIGLVNQFRSLFGLPVNPPQVIIDGNDPGVDGINNPDGPNGDSVEAYLDVEWSGAVAPNATIDLVVAADTQLENGLQLAAEHAVNSNVAPVISLSFGNCESTLGTYNQFLNGLWEQAAAQGITVLVSTGDSGSAGCDDDNTQDYASSGQAVNGFGSTPFNVAVGGTDFYYSAYNQGSTALGNQIATYWNTTASNATPTVSINATNAPIPEQPWNASQYGLNIYSEYASYGDTDIVGGGGGASAVYTTKPSWQTGFGDTVRDLPDVSLFASSGINGSYYPICATDGDCQPVSSGGTVQIFGVGGTSASAPSFAGIMALVNQKYGPQGQADFVLYPLSKQYPAAFHDVTVGTNSVPCEISPTVSTDCIAVSSPITISVTYSNGTTGNVTEGQIGNTTTLTPEYNAGVGYDLASGLGTVDANVLVADWNKVSFSKSTTTLSIPTSFTHGTAVSVSGNVTAASGTPTGDVGLVTDSTEQNQRGQTFFTLSGGAYSGSVNYLPGGTYNVWAQYGGDTNNALSDSAKTQVTVSPEASNILFLVLTPTSTGLEYLNSGTTGIPYGTQLSLSALPAPTAEFAAYENCQIGTATTCPVFQNPTGTVTFKDGSTTLNVAPVNVEGEAEFTPPAGFNAGAHSVTAVYSGDNSYNGSSSATVTFSVVQATPTVLLTTPASPYNQGQPASLNILVEGYGTGNGAGAAPTGSVTLSGVPAGTPTSATLSAGVDPSYGTTVGLATVVIPASAAAGTYNITAAYTPDSASSTNYSSASSSALSVQIAAATGIATTTVASASAASTSPTAAIKVSGTVTAASGAAPTGTVYLLAGIANTSNNGGSGTVVSVGSASLQPGSGTSSSFTIYVDSEALLQGANQLTAYYLGNTTWASSSSSTLINISNPLSDFSLVPNTTLVPLNSGNSYSNTDTIQLASVNGFSGTVNLTCTAALGVNCTITPSVSLGTGGSGMATLTVNTGTWAYPANLPYDVLVTGTSGAYVHTLNVQGVVSGSAAGSSSFMISNSGNITVDGGATTGNTSTITITPVGGFTGPVALSCAVTPTTGTPATCSIPSSVSIAGTSAVTATLTLNTTLATTGGSYTVTVTGTSGSIAPTSVVTATVTSPGLTLTNSGSISIGSLGATTGNTSTITVTPSNGLTGTVALACSATATPTGASTPATCTVAPTSVAISGTTAQTATLTINTTANTTPGTYTFTVTGTEGPIAASTAVSVTAGTPSVSMTNSGAITVTPGAGSGNTSTISVTGSGGFNGAVSLSCSFASNAATDPATCSVSPTSVTVSGATAQTATLTVYTTAATAMNQPNKLFWPSAGGTVLALVFLFGIPKRRRNWLTMLGLLVLFVSAAGMGCGGGGGGSTGGGGTSNPGTSAGTYTVTVTGTSGTLTATTSVTLNVQ